MVRFGRAKDRCEWCKAHNGLPNPVTGSKVILTVAHLDRDPSNNRFANLAALCQRCHIRYDQAQHIRNRKYGRNHEDANRSLPFAPEFYRPTPPDPNKMAAARARGRRQQAGSSSRQSMTDLFPAQKC